ncbi:MAG: hypothetical protein Q4G33_07035 [bacterium]|nr:hypothetical protein [bacterium]
MKPSKERIIYISLLALSTAVLCSFSLLLGKNTATRSAAIKQLEAETALKQEDYNVLLAEKTQLETEIQAFTDDAEANSEVNIKIKEDEDKLTALQTQLDTAKQNNEQITKQLEEKKELLSQVDSVSSSVSGKETKVKANTYSCPSDIETGTYEISGKEGNIIVYGTDNKIRVSINLATTDGNSYTLTIRSGERIKFDKDVTVKGEGKIKSK